MKNLVTIGKVLKPRGLSGEVKCQVLTNIPNAFSRVANVEKVSDSGADYIFIKFKGVNSVEAAETLRGKFIQIDRGLLPLADDEVIADDLIGFEVIGTNGKKLGTVRGIELIGAGEVFDCGHFMFPNEDAFVIETHMRKKHIIVDEKMLEEEVVL